MNDLYEHFPKLRSFLFEVLRLKGPGPYLFFEPTETLEFEGDTISEGAVLVALTRSSPVENKSEVPIGSNGEKLAEFCPHRWLVPLDESNPNGGVKVAEPTNNIGGFLAFGHGARVCPGKQYGEVEVLTIMVYILHTYQVAPVEDHPPLKVVSRFTEKFDGDMTLAVRPRNMLS